MPRSVYVLGAGFSYNFNREEFPLIRDFLETAKTRLIYQPETEHRELAYVISKYFHDASYHDIEKVLSFLSASPLHDRSIPSEHRSVIYDELVEIIVRVLSVASQSGADSHATGDTYERFASHLIETESTVITFNYDLLIDNLLMHTNQWHPYDGYGVDIPLVYKAMPTSPHTYLHQSLGSGLDMHWPKATLLKLHGSINWGWPTIFEDKGEAIYQLPANEGVSIAKFAVKTEFGSPFTLYFKPVIIPPILDKSFWLRNTTFRVLWNMAMEAIDDASTITFIGYSLPVTDFMAEFMFRQGINLHSTETKIVVVDPNASELRNRYVNVFGSAPILEVSFRDCDFVSYANEMLAAAEPRSTEASSS
jgi:hypothetical protein